MKKTILFTLACGFATSQYAQQADSAYTAGSKNDVYYNLSAGTVKSSVAADWDFAFATSPMDVSVLVNDIKGIEVYVASEDIADWATLDTTGMVWKRLFNSETSWSLGAFCNLGTTHPDYGWGAYNQLTHNVTAKRIFVLKFADGSFKKMIIDRSATDGNFDFRMANLDGSGLISKNFNKSTYNTRNFVHYSITGDNFIEYEPLAADWHLVFSKYYSEVSQGPVTAWYQVSGVKTNIGVKVAQRDGVSVGNNDTLGLGYIAAINEIGSDWKTYNNTTFTYEFVADRSYFIKLKDGAIWKIYFTNFKGGANGTSFFTKEKIVGSSGVESLSKANLTIYPNPANAQVSVLADLNTSLWTLELKDINGVTAKRILGSASGFLDISLDLSGISKGVYFVELTTENEKAVRKLCVQ